MAEKALLDKYAPPCAPCVIINHKDDILYTHGRTGKYLELAPGSASLNVFEMAREGLRAQLMKRLDIHMLPAWCVTPSALVLSHPKAEGKKNPALKP
ncbi:MAG: hypothetical protein L0338_37595 [Acidobacteria bacterium]|nr:hypothetical protein [Acidobacteriota bacterium]